MIKSHLMFQSIKNIIKEGQEIKEILNKNSKYLSSGKYRIIGAGKRIVYLKNDDAIKFIEKNQSHLNRGSSNSRNLKLVIKKVITEFSKIKITSNGNNELEDFNGSLIMITRNQDLKIFDFHKGEVLNLLKSKKKYSLIKSAYLNFNNFFDIPIKYFDEKSEYYIEEYVKFKPYDLWTYGEKEKVIEDIFEKYICYIRQYDKQNIVMISIKSLIEEFKQKIVRKDLVDDILKHLDIVELNKYDFPKIMLHGDMNFYNILIANSKLKVIDWEYNGFFVFFYDFLNLIAVEAIFQENDIYLEKYIKGEYDSNFHLIFALMGEKYNAKMKKHYMIIFILERTLNLEIKNNEAYVPIFLNKCLNVIEKIENIEKRIENSEMIK